MISAPSCQDYAQRRHKIRSTDCHKLRPVDCQKLRPVDCHKLYPFDLISGCMLQLSLYSDLLIQWWTPRLWRPEGMNIERRPRRMAIPRDAIAAAAVVRK